MTVARTGSMPLRLEYRMHRPLRSKSETFNLSSNGFRIFECELLEHVQSDI